jgi:hypothetical protein
MRRFLLMAAYCIVSLGIVNLGFPISHYLQNFTFPRSYVASSYLILILSIALFTAIALPLSERGAGPLWFRVATATVFQFVLVSGFAIACSGLGFGWAIRETCPLERLGFFFAEFEWLRFIFETALPLAGCAAVLYGLTGRSEGTR